MRKWTVLLLAIVCACGPSSRQSPGGDDDDSGGDAGGGGGGGGGGGQQGTGSGSDCSDAAKLIYVVDINNKLATFDPTMKTFSTVGTLACAPTVLGVATANPFSMAVDRMAQAYVLYDDGTVYKVDTTQSTLPCTKTAWTAQDGLQEFGMGFSTDMAGGTTDTLFIAGGKSLTGGGSAASTSTFATLDMSSFMATPVGTVSGTPELTGNSNAELWAFSPAVSSGSMPTVQQIDKTNGNATMTFDEPALTGTSGQSPLAWAFGYYGGDYWVFLSLGSKNAITPPPSTVYQIAGPGSMSGTAGSVVSMTSAGNLVVVGAGVSTCAPTQIF